jgi:ribosome recycling factor
MLKELLHETEEKMKKAIDIYRKDLATLRAGRATPALLDKITADYYGTATPINQMANISAPEPRMLIIQPWDKTSMGDIEKAILKSDLGMTPVNDGVVIRLNVPHLTTERRNELVKVIRKKAEEVRVTVRNMRRDANDTVKKAEKDSIVSEDDAKKGQTDIQKLTDKYIKEIDGITTAKEKEVMEV